VRAHLVGGVPRQEVADKKELFEAHGVSPAVIFVERDKDYFDFDPAIAERSDIKNRTENDAGLKDKESQMLAAFDRWWDEYIFILQNLPQTINVMTVRAELLSAFDNALTPQGLLDRFKVSGVFATWWGDVQFDLKSLVAQGFGGLLDGWIDTIEDAMEDKKENNYEPEEDPLVIRLVPEYLEELINARQEISRLEQEKEAFEAKESDDYEGDEEDEEGSRPNFAEILNDRIKELKNKIKEDNAKIKILNGAKKTKGSIKYFEAAGADTAPLQKQLKELMARVAPVEEEVRQIEEQLAPYNEILEKLKDAKKQYKILQQRFIERLREAQERMSEAECMALVLDILKGRLTHHLQSYIAAHRQEVVAAFENWWEKYANPLETIDKDRERAEQNLSSIVGVLYNVK
jgi:type I restriction enzyme M protein